MLRKIYPIYYFREWVSGIAVRERVLAHTYYVFLKFDRLLCPFIITQVILKKIIAITRQSI